MDTGHVEYPGINCCNGVYQKYDEFRDHVKEKHFDIFNKYCCNQCKLENQKRSHLTTIRTLLKHCKNYHFDKLIFTTSSRPLPTNLSENDFINEDVYFDAFEEPDIENFVDEEMFIDEIIFPNLINPTLNKNLDELNYEEKFTIELLKVKSEMSISFASLILVAVTVLTFIKQLNDKGELDQNVLNRLISLSKSKYRILDLSFKVANGINLFKEIKLRTFDAAKQVSKEVKAYVLNLKLAISKFLSKQENVQQLMIQKMKHVNQNFINSIRHLDFFYEAEDELNLFLQIYIDDFDIKNSLTVSSNNTKMCGIYLTIANLPYELQSKRKDQFLLGIIKSSDLHNLEDKNEFFKEIIDQINDLNDHPLEFDNNFKCKPILWSVLADNLESNYLQSLICSFNGESCKYCHISKKELEDKDESILRTTTDHVFKSCKSAVGPLLFAPDIFHDINEGVVLKFFELVFSLNSLQERKRWEANYENCKSFLKNGMLKGIENKHLVGTGTQKLEFFFIFPFLITNQTIFDKRMYDLLRYIIQFCRKDSIEKNSLSEFDYAIKEFLELYRKSIKNYNANFPGDRSKHIKFTFKLHHLYHYSWLIRRFGLLKHSSTVRGERFHQTHKYAISTSKSKINVPNQICNNWSILYILGDYVEKFFLKIISVIEPRSFESALSPEVQKLIKNEYDPSKELVNLSEVIINNKKIKLDEIYLDKKNYFNNYPSFIKVNLIMKQEHHLWIKGNLYQTVDYDTDHHSYILQETNQTINFELSNLSYQSFTVFRFKDQIHLINDLN